MPAATQRCCLSALSVLALVACSNEARVAVDTFGTPTSGPVGTAPTDTGPATTSTDAAGTSTRGVADSTSVGTEIKLDVGAPRMDVGEIDSCACANGNWSYLWVAQSTVGTVARVNTRTMEIEGRFSTGPTGFQGNPSRTSVSLDGRAVVVANRTGGVVKIWSRPEFCDASNNGQPGLQTSSDSTVLPWGEDDCVDWYLPFENVSTQRPVAWTGAWEQESCSYLDQKVWTATGIGEDKGAAMLGMCDTLTPDGVSEMWVHRIDGETGLVEADVLLTGLPCPLYGPYGAAADLEGNLWLSSWEQMVRVDAQTLEFEVVGSGGYGITVDAQGRVWQSGALKVLDPFDMSETFFGWLGPGGGIAEDRQGRIWTIGDSYEGVTWIDGETLTIGGDIEFGEQVWGVSVDIDGYIWAVGQQTSFKMDPETFDVESMRAGGYTYSDMSGGQLQNVVCTPAG